jgi:hypothetical protein
MNPPNGINPNQQPPDPAAPQIFFLASTSAEASASMYNYYASMPPPPPPPQFPVTYIPNEQVFYRVPEQQQIVYFQQPYYLPVPSFNPEFLEVEPKPRYVPPVVVQVQRTQDSAQNESSEVQNFRAANAPTVDAVLEHTLFPALFNILEQATKEIPQDCLNCLFQRNPQRPQLPLGLILPKLGLMHHFNYPHSYVDIDDLLLLHFKDQNLSVRGNESLVENFGNLEAEMERLVSEMQEMRPLLTNELAARKFFLTTSLRVLQVELHLSNPHQVRKKSRKLPDSAQSMLQQWFDENLHHAYPSSGQKRNFSEQGGITLQQVDYWFTNARFRNSSRIRHAVKQHQKLEKRKFLKPSNKF